MRTSWQPIQAVSQKCDVRPRGKFGVKS